jgi:hypothetical protein
VIRYQEMKDLPPAKKNFKKFITEYRNKEDDLVNAEMLNTTEGDDIDALLVEGEEWLQEKLEELEKQPPGVWER